MIVLFGATGYVGRAFADELRRRRLPFVPLSRQTIDCSDFTRLFDYLRHLNPSFVINAAGFVGRADQEDCEEYKAASLQANTVFPQHLVRACSLTNTPLGHVSSGSVFSGAKMAVRMRFRVVRDLSRPVMVRLSVRRPECLGGFTEFDEPNHSFRNPPCSFYAGTKALAEELLSEWSTMYIWRPNVLFDELAHPRNFLCGFHCHPEARQSLNSFSHRGDFVRACLDLWEQRAPFGIYNVVNPCPLTPYQVMEKIRQSLGKSRNVDLLCGANGTGVADATAPRTAGCVLDTSKLETCGVRLRSALHALEDSVRKWRSMANESACRSWMAHPETGRI